MKKIASLLLFLALIAITTASSQTIGYFITDLKGEPIANNYSKVTDGSPFFAPEWLKGKATGVDGKVYDNLTAKLNLLDPGIHFQDDEMKEYRLTVPMRELILSDPASGQSFRFLRAGIQCQGKPEAWYQVISEGPAVLYKLDTRVLTEIKPYGSASTEEHISPVVRYFLQSGQDCQPVKSPAQLWELLSVQAPGFIEKPAGKTNAKKMEDELLRLMKAFNSRG